MSDLTTLPGTLEFAWDALARGVASREAPCRFGVLATVGAGGEARMVVLRAADGVVGTVEVHSDTATGKVVQISAEPRATLLFWLPAQQLQIRLRATFAILKGAAAQHRWQDIPDGPRRAYGGRPPPGDTIAAPSDHDATPEFERFAVLIGTVSAIETLHLGMPHRRAQFTRDEGFAGRWIAP